MENGKMFRKNTTISQSVFETAHVFNTPQIFTDYKSTYQLGEIYLSCDYVASAGVPRLTCASRI